MATLTQFLKLYKPVVNEVGWDDNMNSNLDIVDAFVRQFMSVPNFQGLWANNHAYAVGQVTLDAQTSGLFNCLVAHTSATTGTFAQDRTARPTFWALANNPSQQFAQQAANSASAAAASATAASNSLTSFQNTYYGGFATDPLNDPHGHARTAGDLYFNTTTSRLRVWDGVSWVEITATFADAPTTPAGSVWLRSAAHAWVQGVAQSGGLFTGNVTFAASTTVASVPPPAQANAGQSFANVHSSTFASTINTYISQTSPTGYRYQTTSPAITGGASSGVGAAWLLSNTANSGPAGAQNHPIVLFAARGAENIVADAVATPVQIASWGSDGTFAIAGGTAFKPGGGTWTAGSDVRIKNVIGPYPHGLAELLEMLPKLFTYKGNDQRPDPDTGAPGEVIHQDTTTQFIGLIAQDCEPYMPELVTQGACFIDGVWQTDVRQLDATGVIYALVNAVAELNGMITKGVRGLARNMTTINSTADLLENELFGFSMPAGFTMADGDTIHVVARGTTLGSTDSKTLRVKLGAATCASVACAAATNTTWWIQAWITKVPGAGNYTNVEVKTNASNSFSNFTSNVTDTTDPIRIGLTAQNITNSVAASMTLQTFWAEYFPAV